MPRKPQKKVAKKASNAMAIEYHSYGYYTLPSGNKSSMKAFLFNGIDMLGWDDVKKEIIPDFIKEHPCQRPYSWWKYEAPEPRQRVGNAPGRRSEMPLYKFGLPDCGWIEINPNNLPKYESEAAYLSRHGLLTAQEREWLADHPEAMEPVSLDQYRIEVNPFVHPMYYEPPKWVK